MRKNIPSWLSHSHTIVVTVARVPLGAKFLLLANHEIGKSAGRERLGMEETRSGDLVIKSV